MTPSRRLKLVGLDDWEGEIVGDAATGGRFDFLRIGMKESDVVAVLGQPDEQCFRVTAKALLPMNFGSDQYRVEYVYKGVGRLILSSAAAMQAMTEMHLIWIIHNPAEAGRSR